MEGGGTISGNAAKSTQATTPGIYGGAIYISDYEEQSGLPGENAIHPYEASFTMTGGTISGNSAEEVGGAILSFPQGYRESFSQDITTAPLQTIPPLPPMAVESPCIIPNPI